MELDDVVLELGAMSDKLDIIISRLDDIVELQEKILREVG